MLIYRFLIWPMIASLANAFNNIAFNELVGKLKADAFEFAREVERLYTNRCDIDTMNSCTDANYGECQIAQYPQQQCLEGPNYRVDACHGSSTGHDMSSSCGALWDFSVSYVDIFSEGTVVIVCPSLLTQNILGRIKFLFS